jgi:microcystin-dependent protein
MKFTKITAALFALLLAFPASAEVYDWSQTPGSNNTADTGSDVQWSEGMAPSDVNDSARAMMAELRKFLDDLGASATSSTLIASAGSSTVYTLVTEGSADNLENGRVVCFAVDETNGAAPTMNVDGLGAKEIFVADGTALTGGEMVANTIQCLSYSVAGDAAAGAWLMRNRFITVEAGGGIENDGVTGALQRSALTGDVTASAGSNTTDIANDAVQYAEMQDVSATDRFLGRDTVGSGDAEEITVAAAYLMTHGADPNADRISFWDDSDSAPDYLAVDSTLTISGNTLSRADLTGDVTTSTNAATIANNAVALGTDTTGNYVLDVADGTGIDGTASAEGATYTPSLDLTEISSGTWGAGSFTAFTYNAGAVDPVETFGSGTVIWSALTSFSLDDESQIRLYEEDSNGSSYFALIAPNALAGNVTCTISATGMIPDSCVGDGTDAAGSGGDEAGSDRDAGDMTVSSSGVLITIDNDAVTHAKYQNIATDSLVGRDSASTGSPEELSVGGGIEFTGSGGIQRSALSGDVNVTAGSGTTDIPASAVDYAEIQNVSATDRFLGRDTASAGVMEEITGTNAFIIINGADPGADRISFWDDSAGTPAYLAVDSSLSITTTTMSRAALTGDVTASAGSNTTALSTAVSDRLRDVGELIVFAGTTCPSGSLEANGAAVSRTTYSVLFGVIAETWGQGDNSTTFNLPDMRAAFARGWDHGAGFDPDAASRTAIATGGATGDNVGSFQADGFEAHTHGAGSYNVFEGIDEANLAQGWGEQDGMQSGGGINNVMKDGNAVDPDLVDGTVSGTSSSTGGNETRPTNVYVLYCVYTGV